MTTTSNLLWGALAIGVVTGMRSMLAPTMVSQALADRADIEGAGEPARTLASRQVRRYVMPLAAGELFGDKMPFAPDRTIAPSLLVRALSGGISAAALAGARRQPILLPALIGSSAACLAAKLAIDLRKRYGTNAWVNAGLGLAEDCLAVSLGNAGLRRALQDR
ncbi:DUF4126 domain-containing protein [Pseudomonas sp. MS15a(2019)]|uniref:DUF4126 domain-containing protein n=1 Tax=Pseudomonas TaxID=286 RepID=UPI001566BA8C|nr:DUF4126 domain-containing protein [Pseudomonas sp. MS15a(2019)]NRH41526.1 DUF4126 domain-containing protein [Pseudomonas sp. MS15a(2019)]